LGYNPLLAGTEVTVLEGIFGNASAEKVLLYLEQYGEGYATAIARAFDDLSLNMAQRQLDRFERAGALVSTLKGRTRLYTWNPRYPFAPELRSLLAKALDFLPAAERRRFFSERRRPRRTGKPL
jgi:hypothetical protein